MLEYLPVLTRCSSDTCVITQEIPQRKRCEEDRDVERTLKYVFLLKFTLCLNRALQTRSAFFMVAVAPYQISFFLGLYMVASL